VFENILKGTVDEQFSKVKPQASLFNYKKPMIGNYSLINYLMATPTLPIRKGQTLQKSAYASTRNDTN